jgi:ribosomal-protein-alanine N-acetyltransferase
MRDPNDRRAMIEEISFRPLGLETVGQIMPVMQLAFPAEYGEAWTAPQVAALLMLPGTVLVAAEIDGRIVGFALSRCVLDECELLLLAVDPAVRRRGIGQAILRSVKDNAAQRGARQVMLEVRESNVQALALYVRSGFSEIGRRPNYYKAFDGTLLDALSMRVEIGA